MSAQKNMKAFKITGIISITIILAFVFFLYVDAVSKPQFIKKICDSVVIGEKFFDFEDMLFVKYKLPKRFPVEQNKSNGENTYFYGVISTTHAACRVYVKDGIIVGKKLNNDSEVR